MDIDQSVQQADALPPELQLPGFAAAIRRDIEQLQFLVQGGDLVLGVALRHCPPLPPAIADRIRDYRASNVADWVMYRKALASAAEARGWPVHWYDAKKVLDAASQVLRVENFDAHFLHLRKTVGPPWNNDHKLAMAAAIAAANVSVE